MNRARLAGKNGGEKRLSSAEGGFQCLCCGSFRLSYGCWAHIFPAVVVGQIAVGVQDRFPGQAGKLAEQGPVVEGHRRRRV